MWPSPFQNVELSLNSSARKSVGPCFCNTLWPPLYQNVELSVNWPDRKSVGHSLYDTLWPSPLQNIELTLNSSGRKSAVHNFYSTLWPSLSQNVELGAKLVRTQIGRPQCLQHVVACSCLCVLPCRGNCVHAPAFLGCWWQITCTHHHRHHHMVAVSGEVCAKHTPAGIPLWGMSCLCNGIPGWVGTRTPHGEATQVGELRPSPI